MRVGFFIIIAVLLACVGAMIAWKVLVFIVGVIYGFVTAVIDGEKIDKE